MTDPALPRHVSRHALRILSRAPAEGATPAQAGRPDYSDSGFLRFVEGMQLWDRAMAQAIVQQRSRTDPPLVVGLMGSGHLENRYGVPHQLRDLGIKEAAVLLPWDRDSDCADADRRSGRRLFGLSSRTSGVDGPAASGCDAGRQRPGRGGRDVAKAASQSGRRTLGRSIVAVAGGRCRAPAT